MNVAYVKAHAATDASFPIHDVALSSFSSNRFHGTDKNTGPAPVTFAVDVDFRTSLDQIDKTIGGAFIVGNDEVFDLRIIERRQVVFHRYRAR